MTSREFAGDCWPVPAPTLERAEHILSADFAAETTEANIRWKGQEPEEVEARARDLVLAYLTAHGDQKVVGVEQRFEVDVTHPESGETLPRSLVGYFDLVVDKGDSIVEVKTSSKTWHPASLDRHLQVGAYVAAANATHGGPAEVHVHVIVKNKKPKVEVHRVTRGESDNGWFFEAARAIEAAIHARQFPPAPGPTCIECEYGRACLSHREQVVPLRKTGSRPWQPPRVPPVHAAV